LLWEIFGWLAFLQRTDVWLQLLPLLVMAVGLSQLRRLPRQRRLGPLWRLPASLLLFAGEVLIALLLTWTGQRQGLVLLAIQINVLWLLLRLVELQLLARVLSPEARQLLVTRLIRPLFLLFVALRLFDALGSLEDIAAAPLGVWFGSAITVGQLSRVLLVLYLLLVGLELPSRWLSLLFKRGLSMSEGSRQAAEQILHYLLVALGVVWALASLGVNQTGVLAVAGGLSVGLGFGIKEVFSNIISGLWLLIEGSLRPGGVLLHGGEVCEVRRLGPRATTLWRKRDNAELMVPNQDFFTTATTSYTLSDRNRRCSLPLSVSRNWQPDQIQALLISIASGHPAVPADPAPVARLNAFGPDRYEYTLSFSIADPLRSGAVSSDLRLAICSRFRELGIDPPG
ncbi:MAG: mechanosensitive ion channel family protein, partial [Cyanobium sp.]